MNNDINISNKDDLLISCSELEYRLIHKCRQLNAEGLEKTFNYIAMLVDTGKYSKKIISMKWAKKKTRSR